MKRAGTAILFLIIGIVVVPACAWAYLQFGGPPVAVADPLLPFEETIAKSALHARIEHERPTHDPVPVNEATLKEGATVYMSACSFCHGVPGTESKIGTNTFPRTPQFFRPRPAGNRPPPDLARRAGGYHWYVEHGVRLTAMPSFTKTLTDTEQWEVSNLLAGRENPLPESVKKVLATPVN
jgi:mono/diheme cytochrome c family protein